MLASVGRYLHWFGNLWAGMFTGYDFNEAERQLAAARIRCETAEQEALIALGVVIRKLTHAA